MSGIYLRGLEGVCNGTVQPYTPDRVLCTLVSSLYIPNKTHDYGNVEPFFIGSATPVPLTFTITADVINQWVNCAFPATEFAGLTDGGTNAAYLFLYDGISVVPFSWLTMAAPENALGTIRLAASAVRPGYCADLGLDWYLEDGLLKLFNGTFNFASTSLFGQLTTADYTPNRLTDVYADVSGFQAAGSSDYALSPVVTRDDVNGVVSVGFGDSTFAGVDDPGNSAKYLIVYGIPSGNHVVGFKLLNPELDIGTPVDVTLAEAAIGSLIFGDCPQKQRIFPNITNTPWYPLQAPGNTGLQTGGGTVSITGAWRPNAIGGTQPIFQLGDAANKELQLEIDATGKLVIKQGNGATFPDTTNTTTAAIFSAGVWTWFAVVIDAVVQVFANGVSAALDDDTRSLVLPATVGDYAAVAANIGTDRAISTGAAGHYWDWRLYNATLTPSDVADIYTDNQNFYLPPEQVVGTDLARWWQMTEQAGGEVQDWSANDSPLTTPDESISWGAP